MANALTAVRLALALPVAVALARPELLAPGVVALLIGLGLFTILMFETRRYRAWRGGS